MRFPSISSIGRTAGAALLSAGGFTSVPAVSDAMTPALLAVGATSQHHIYGTVQTVRGTTLVIRTRTGRMLTVDGRAAHSYVVLSRNRPIIVNGTLDTFGVLHAGSIWRTYPDAAHWPADR